MSNPTIMLDGNPIHLKGEPAGEGESFPDVRLSANPAEEVTFGDEKNEAIHIITTAVSIDTPVCANQFRAFDERAEQLADEGIEVWYVTRDLPFALQRFADEHDLDHLSFLSDYKFREFGEATGLAVEETELLARATFVVDRAGEIVYSEVLDEIADEPDYDAAVEAARAAN